MLERIQNRKTLKMILAIVGMVLILSITCMVPAAPIHAATTPQKNAHVNNDAVDNGTSASPVPVRLSDKITYEVIVDKSAPAGAKYDIIFALDWSRSMSGQAVGGSMVDDNGGWISARDYAKNLILEMCQHVFANYPDSRIAVMGLNASRSNYNDPRKVNLQYDTSFVGASGYASVIAAAFDKAPTNHEDDNAQFLRAAIDKMKGDASVIYGQDVGNGSNAKSVIPRDIQDPDRIPVIVLISDFQARDGTETANLGQNYSGRRYWAECMKEQSDRFASAYPNKGILLTVRFDHIRIDNSFANPYVGSTYDNYMRTYVSPAGRNGWGFVSLAYTKPPKEGLKAVKDFFNASAPPPTVTLVTDKVPNGLTIIDTSPAAIVNNQTVAWDLTKERPGQIKLTVVAEVSNPPANTSGNYENTAVLSIAGKPESSNTTYHRLSNDLILHIRQMIVTPASGTQKPLAGYFSLSNDGRSMQISGDSGVHGYGLTDYAAYKLTLSGTDKAYRVYDFVPQYYAFAGHIQNSGSAAAAGHDSLAGLIPPATAQNGQILLDYSTENELWLTIYLKPAGNPGDYEWSYASNNFGTVN